MSTAGPAAEPRGRVGRQKPPYEILRSQLVWLRKLRTLSIVPEPEPSFNTCEGLRSLPLSLVSREDRTMVLLLALVSLATTVQWPAAGNSAESAHIRLPGSKGQSSRWRAARSRCSGEVQPQGCAAAFKTSGTVNTSPYGKCYGAHVLLPLSSMQHWAGGNSSSAMRTTSGGLEMFKGLSSKVGTFAGRVIWAGNSSFPPMMRR